MGAITFIAMILLVVGGLNWGLVGLAQFDLVAAIFGGQDTMGARIVYTLVGLAALWQIIAGFTMGRARAAACSTAGRD